MIPYMTIDRRLALFVFADKLCTRLVSAHIEGKIQESTFIRYYDYYDGIRYHLGKRALYRVYLRDL